MPTAASPRCGSPTARELPADLVDPGHRQSKLPELIAQFPGVTVDGKGRVVVEESTGRTGNPKVFAGGDALGGELVVTAVQEGKRAARAICATLGSEGPPRRADERRTRLRRWRRHDSSGSPPSSMERDNRQLHEKARARRRALA